MYIVCDAHFEIMKIHFLDKFLLIKTAKLFNSGMTNLLSLAVSEVIVIVTTSGETSNYKAVIMTTFPFKQHCCPKLCFVYICV